MQDVRKNPEKYPLSPHARAFSAEQERMVREMETEKYTKLLTEMASLLNKYSIENNSDTPDFILAEYLLDCLSAWEHATAKRDRWFKS